MSHPGQGSDELSQVENVDSARSHDMSHPGKDRTN